MKKECKFIKKNHPFDLIFFVNYNIDLQLFNIDEMISIADWAN